MLKVIPGYYASFFPREMHAMFLARAKVFKGRRGWNVKVHHNGYERDEFDDLQPLYLVAMHPDTEEYWGSLRLLPTIGPNMLNDVFRQLLPEGESIADSHIWESSRIHTVAAARQHHRGTRGVFQELLAGIAEVARLEGWKQIVSVYDEPMSRVMRSAGIKFEHIGRSEVIGEFLTHAGIFDLSPETVKNLKEKIGIGPSFLAPDALELLPL